VAGTSLISRQTHEQPTAGETHHWHRMNCRKGSTRDPLARLGNGLQWKPPSSEKSGVNSNTSPVRP